MAQGMNAPLYTTEILRLAGSLPDPAPAGARMARRSVRSPTCGSRVESAVQLDGEGRIEAMSQQVHACAFGQASAALLDAAATGAKRSEVDRRTIGWPLARRRDDQRATWPGLDALAPARSRTSRHGAILLPFRALLAAIEAAG